MWKRRSLVGLKENVIVGRLIPAGTGYAMKVLKKSAIDSLACEREKNLEIVRSYLWLLS